MRSIALTLLLILALTGNAPARQGAPKSAEEQKKDTKTLPAPPAENWTALGDLKTGLQSPAVAEVQRDEQPDFVRELVRVQWRSGDPIDLWIARPKVSGKVPVILYLYSYSDVNDRFHDNGWCKRATAGGFAAVGFVSALTDYRFKNRPMKQWFVSELPEALGSTVHDVQLILNTLADRDDIDMDRVGMFGLGSGATIAVLAAHADSRIKALDLLDPWGDWPDWLRTSPVVPEAERTKYLTPEFLKSVAGLDPVASLPSLKNRSVRLQQNASEPTIPEAVREKIAAVVPDQKDLLTYENAQALFRAWQASGLSGWLKQQLRPESRNVAAVTERP